MVYCGVVVLTSILEKPGQGLNITGLFERQFINRSGRPMRGEVITSFLKAMPRHASGVSGGSVAGNQKLHGSPHLTY
jgi:hypothetical protein